jgi:2-C-methyl-D-erythritol 4-phosphate cytidylyltransferase
MIGGDDIDAIVLAAGRGSRLGLGSKAWLTLGGRTLLERAVATMRAVAGGVTVGVAADDLERARAQCGDRAVVVSGGATHRETMVAAFGAGHASLVVVHDVAHPFVTLALAHEVIEAARRRGAAVAAVRAAASAYRWAPGSVPRRVGKGGEIWTLRRPLVFRRADFLRCLAEVVSEESISDLLERVGVSIELVPTPSWNINVTTPDDWALARAIEETVRPL